VHAITLDNAHSNNTFVQELSSLFQNDGVEWRWEELRFRCFNHIMNLAVQNGLGNLQETIEKVFDVRSSVSDPMITFLKNDDTAAKDREDDASFASEDRAARERVSSVFDRLRQARAGCIDQMEQHL